jgi:hypothetical protein
MCPNEKKLSGTWSSDQPHGLVDAKVIGGYESYHLLDMSRYTFSFCEKCLRQLFVQCKIKPEVHDMDFNGNATEDTWERDHESYEYRVWKDAGLHHQAYVDRKCNAKKDCPNRAVYTRLHHGDEDDGFTENCCCEEHKEVGAYSNSRLTKFISRILRPFL